VPISGAVAKGPGEGIPMPALKPISLAMVAALVRREHSGHCPLQGQAQITEADPSPHIITALEDIHMVDIIMRSKTF